MWYITDLKIGSATAALSANDIGGVPLRVVREYVDGVRVAESGEALPPYFSDTSLARLGRMAKSLGSQNAQYLDLSIGQNGSTQSARATKQTADNIRMLRSPRSRAIGSITGILDTISLRKNAKFQVVDPVSNRPVTCHFPKDHKEVVTNALERHVVVSGIVVRNAKGQPIKIDDAEFEILPAVTSPLVELVGLDTDFTGGLSLHDYMEHICS